MLRENIAVKKKKVKVVEARLHTIISQKIRKANYEAALEAIAACAEIEYQWNQSYVDEYLEKALLDIQNNILNSDFIKEDADEQTVLFYDGFGLDNRGLMLNYVDALLTLGYRVIYVTTCIVKGKQPILAKMASGKKMIWEYLPFSQKFFYSIQKLNDTFLKYHPAKAFLYTLPYDVTGICVFSHYTGIVERYQINLTDHTFWLGKYAFDYCLEFRDYGANISRLYRGVETERLIKIPYCPYVDSTLSFEGFPFKENGYKIVFSGGGLYKTFDSENTYYKLVKEILIHDEKVIFLYAGSGDDSELKKLMDEFPKRVWHIAERKDLYQLMEHIHFYLSTYPLSGGLMIQYAALAGKVPVTIAREEDLKEILDNQKTCRYIFDNKEEALQESYKLLDDPQYAEQKGHKLAQSVMRKDKFQNALGLILTEHTSPFIIQEKEMDVTAFLQGYLFRFNLEELKRIITKDEYWELRKRFPLFFLKKRMRNFIVCLKQRMEVKR